MLLLCAFFFCPTFNTNIFPGNDNFTRDIQTPHRNRSELVLILIKYGDCKILLITKKKWNYYSFYFEVQDSFFPFLNILMNTSNGSVSLNSIEYVWIKSISFVRGVFFSNFPCKLVLFAFDHNKREYSRFNGGRHYFMMSN